MRRHPEDRTSAGTTERPVLLASERSGFYVTRGEATGEPTTGSLWAWIWFIVSLLAALITMAP